MELAHKPGKAWLDTLDSSVSRQKQLLQALLSWVESDERCRYLLVGCSLGRGVGDELSDIDARIGIVEQDWPYSIGYIMKEVRQLGMVVDQQDQPYPDSEGRLQHHIITVYEDNLQLSLVVTPASWVKRLRYDAVVLYDPEDLLPDSIDHTIGVATPVQAREWAFLAWLNLTDAAKYLKRGSLWEALERLHKARTHTWQLWAVAQKLDFALYGVTQVLDDQVDLPKGLQKTVTSLNSGAIHEACVTLIDILDDVMVQASRAIPFELPLGMAQTARNQLAAQ